MYRGCRVAVVMPAYNVEHHVGPAVASVPAFVDDLLVVDDGSDDDTAAAARSSGRGRATLISHDRNRGVGAAITSGYAEALRRGAQLVAVMAGDGQMDPADLPAVLDPLVDGRADYVKGNRFLHPDVWRCMPRARIVGNLVLSVLTRYASGYRASFDSQCGYTAISSRALRAIDARLYPRYGYPNELLVRLKSTGARVVDVCVRPVYRGEPSGIRVRTVLHPILTLLFRALARRLWQRTLRRLLGPRGEVPVEALQLETITDADRRPDHFVPAPRR